MLYRDERVRMMAAESVPQAPPAQAREMIEVCWNRLACSAMSCHWVFPAVLSVEIWQPYRHTAATRSATRKMF